MQMEVVVAVPPPPPPLPPMDFNFDSNCSSPYITAPSSPQRFGNFFLSAPTSPSRASSFSHRQQLNNHNGNIIDGNEDFEFDFSGHLQRPSLSADELFDGGKIRPLNLTTNNASSTRKNIAQVAIDKKDSDTFDEPMKGTRKREEEEEEEEEEEKAPPQQQKQHKRGRQRDSSSYNSKESRGSLSPLRVSQTSNKSDNNDKGVSSLFCETAIASLLSSIGFRKGYRKWRLKDFLLFRSASEGRGTDKDPLRKYAVLSKTTAHEDVGNYSFRSTEENSGSVSKRRVSAHELHYTVNRAASEELKKKTLLPYKYGLLGCLRFNTGSGMHHISTRMGSLERS